MSSSHFALKTPRSSICNHGHHTRFLLQWYGNDSEERPRLNLPSEEVTQLQSQSCLALGPSRTQLSKQKVLSAPGSKSHHSTGHWPAAAPPAASGNGLMFLLWSYPPGQLHTLQKSNIHSSPYRLPRYFGGKARKGKKFIWLIICRIFYQKHL